MRPRISAAVRICSCRSEIFFWTSRRSLATSLSVSLRRARSCRSTSAMLCWARAIEARVSPRLPSISAVWRSRFRRRGRRSRPLSTSSLTPEYSSAISLRLRVAAFSCARRPMISSLSRAVRWRSTDCLLSIRPRRASKMPRWPIDGLGGAQIGVRRQQDFREVDGLGVDLLGDQARLARDRVVILRGEQIERGARARVVEAHQQLAGGDDVAVAHHARRRRCRLRDAAPSCGWISTATVPIAMAALASWAAEAHSVEPPISMPTMTRPAMAGPRISSRGPRGPGVAGPAIFGACSRALMPDTVILSAGLKAAAGLIGTVFIGLRSFCRTSAVGPKCCGSPSCITITLSAWVTRLVRCVMTMVVQPLNLSCLSVLISCCSPSASRLALGSSSTTKRGLPNTARASAMRWRWPPDRGRAAVADLGLVALRQLQDHLMHARQLGGAHDIFRRSRRRRG